MPKLLNDIDKIYAWLEGVGIATHLCEINNVSGQLVVDVDFSVFLQNMNLSFIAVKFGHVNGDFDISNNKLITLQGSPKVVDGSFNVDNNNLTSLMYSPNIVYEYYSCANNNLTNLRGITPRIHTFLNAEDNNINSLEFLPMYCSEIALQNNPLLGGAQEITDFLEIKKIQAIELEKSRLLKSIPIKRVLETSLNKDTNNHKI